MIQVNDRQAITRVATSRAVRLARGQSLASFPASILGSSWDGRYLPIEELIFQDPRIKPASAGRDDDGETATFHGHSSVACLFNKTIMRDASLKHDHTGTN
jgi:hypothetical protein